MVNTVGLGKIRIVVLSHLLLQAQMRVMGGLIGVLRYAGKMIELGTRIGIVHAEAWHLRF